MKIGIFLIIFLLSAISATAQIAQPSPTESRRPRVVVTATPYQTPSPRPVATPPISSPTFTPSPTPQRVIIVNGVPPKYSPTPQTSPSPRPFVTPTPYQTPKPSPNIAPGRVGLLTFGQIRARITEAKRLMQTRPVQTSAVTGFTSTEIVTIAALDPKTQAMHLISLSKESFLTVGNLSYVTSSLNKLVRVSTIRANGVNTAVMVYDDTNQPFVPLIVQYPIERGGSFQEMAYYTSAHPTLLSSEVTRAGQLYVRTTIETGLKKLRERGVYISPAVAAIAEELCLIEHVDHQRFLNESRPALYDEIFTLFALNEGNTYRYAVSTAGAGGLVQMIPATYRMVRSQHPNITLIPDFVTGMRDHVNAVQAELLYMQDTWNDLLMSDTINNALETGIATDAELMAAGYNSNPARLASYIRRSGANWKYAIPRETQMYLQIQRSVQATIPKLPPIK